MRICYSCIFPVAVIALFWRQCGLTLSDIFTLQAIFSFSIVILEVPTGFLADVWGRRNTLIFSALIGTMTWFFYAGANQFWHFAIIEVLLGGATSLLSGADSALLYETLLAMGKTDEFTAREGRQIGNKLLGEGFSALIGGFLAHVYSVPLLLVATGFAYAVAVGCAWCIVEPPRKGYEHPRGTIYGLYKIGRYIFLKSVVVRHAVPLMACGSLCTLLGVWLYQPLWEKAEIPVWLFGILWSLMSLSSALASHRAGWLENRCGPRVAVAMIFLPAYVGYPLLALAPFPFFLVGPYIVYWVRGLVHPILSRYVHLETFSDKRATVISFQNLLMRLGYCVFGPMVGWIGENQGIPRAFSFIALWCFIILLPQSVLFYRKLGGPEVAELLAHPPATRGSG